MDAVTVKLWAWRGLHSIFITYKTSFARKAITGLTAPLSCRINNLTSQAMLLPGPEIYVDGFLPVKCFEQWAGKVYSKLEGNSHDLFNSFHQTLSSELLANLEIENTDKMNSSVTLLGLTCRSRNKQEGVTVICILQSTEMRIVDAHWEPLWIEYSACCGKCVI